MSTQVQQNVHQSRFGYHPCDYPTFCKLKVLNKVYQLARSRAAAWKRWDRKAPHNRIVRERIRNSSGQVVGYRPPVPMPEPEIIPIFSEKVCSQSFYRNGQYDKNGFDVCNVELDPPTICEDYFNARHPKASPEEVVRLRLSQEEIDRMYLDLSTALPL